MKTQENMKNEIFLYGEISASGENSAAKFRQRFIEASKDAESVSLHLHSPGGEVLEGIAIYNILSQSKVPADVYIDGFAASMATVVMLAARRIYAAKNSMIMVHAPSGGSYGNAADLESAAKAIRDLETIMVSSYAKRTGRAEDDVKAWMQGDNWFTAQEALDANLIDDIVDATDVDMMLSSDDIKKTPAGALLAMFKAAAPARLITNTKNSMNKKELIEKFSLAGLTEASSDAEITAAIEAKITASDTALAEFKKKQIKTVLDAAIAQKKIAETDRETYQTVGEANGIEVLEKLLAGLSAPKQQSIISQLGGKTPAADRAAWTWDEWQEKDAAGLEKMAVSDSEHFEALYKAKYGA